MDGTSTTTPTSGGSQETPLSPQSSVTSNTTTTTANAATQGIPTTSCSSSSSPSAVSTAQVIFSAAVSSALDSTVTTSDDVVQEIGTQGSQEVFQIFLEGDTDSGEAGSSLRLVPVSSGANSGATLQALGTDDDGQVTYVQVEAVDGPSLTEESLLEAMEAADVTQASDVNEVQTIGGQAEAEQAHMTTMAQVVESMDIMEMNEVDDDPSQVQQYLLQTPTNYKMDLLQAIYQGVSDKTFDFPIFCQDGVIWSNKLLLTSVSTFVKTMLSELGEHIETCIILPELTKMEFMTFHKALFAQENDTSLDFVTLIKVAEILGAELSLTTHFPPNEDAFPEVNYKSVMDCHHERKKVFQALGYDATSLPVQSSKNSDWDTVLSSLSSVLNSEYPCELCQRSFVDATSLKHHQNMLHSGRTVAGFAKDAYAYECHSCRKTFAYAINVKKHKWLCHVKPKKEILAKPSKKPLSDDVIAKRHARAKEKHEDMTCKVCAQEFNTWKQLQVHMMDHTNERPFKCEICGRGFKEQQKLRRHAVCHTGEKNFSCKFCGKTFGLRHNMKAHERIHEGRGNECKFCGKNYTQSSNLRDHERVHVLKKHVATNNLETREKQRLAKSRGRPSIMEKHQRMIKEKKEREESLLSKGAKKEEKIVASEDEEDQETQESNETKVEEA